MRRALALSFLLASSAPAQTDSGRAALAFDLLQEPLGARSAALGQAVEAGGPDPRAWRQSPGLLARQGAWGLGLDHELWLAGASRESLSLASPAQRWGAVGLQGSWIAYPELDLRDDQGARTGSFHAQDWGLGIGWGLHWEGLLDLGLQGSLLHQSLPSQSLDGASWGLGLAFGSARPWSLSLAFEDRPVISGREERRAYGGRLGLSWQRALSQGFAVAALSSLRLEAQGPSALAVGLELPWQRSVWSAALRAGGSWQVPSAAGYAGGGYSLGAGLRRDAWSLDYAYLPLAELGATQQLSLTWQGSARTPAGQEAALPVADPLPAPPPLPALPALLGLSRTAFTVLSDRYLEAQALEAQGRSQAAFERYRQAVAEDPEDGPSWEALARLYQAAGQAVWAQQCLERAKSLRK